MDAHSLSGLAMRGSAPRPTKEDGPLAARPLFFLLIYVARLETYRTPAACPYSTVRSLGPLAALMDQSGKSRSYGQDDTTQMRSIFATRMTYDPAGTGLGGDRNVPFSATLVFVKKLIGWGITSIVWPRRCIDRRKFSEQLL